MRRRRRAVFLHPPAGEFLRVDHGAGIEAVQQQDSLSDESAGEDLIHLVFAVHLAEGDAAVDELLHIGGVLPQGSPLAQQERGDALDHPVVTVAVDDVQPPLPVADVEVAVDDVEIPARPQEVVQYFLVF